MRRHFLEVLFCLSLSGMLWEQSSTTLVLPENEFPEPWARETHKDCNYETKRTISLNTARRPGWKGNFFSRFRQPQPPAYHLISGSKPTFKIFAVECDYIAESYGIVHGTWCLLLHSTILYCPDYKNNCLTASRSSRGPKLHFLPCRAENWGR